MIRLQIKGVDVQCRVEHNFLWGYFARKNEPVGWHFMGSVYHFLKDNNYILWEEV